MVIMPSCCNNQISRRLHALQVHVCGRGLDAVFFQIKLQRHPEVKAS